MQSRITGGDEVTPEHKADLDTAWSILEALADNGWGGRISFGMADFEITLTHNSGQTLTEDGTNFLEVVETLKLKTMEAI